MRRLLVLLVLLVPVLLAAAVTVPAADGSTAPTVAEGRTGTAAKTAVRSTLKQTGAVLKGRLVSDRKSCVSGRDVYLVIRSDTQDYPFILYVDTTNGQGRWHYDTTTRRGSTTRLAAITLGGRTCDIAQSNQITYDEPRAAGAHRAGGLADVTITLQGSGDITSARGRVTSSRAVCTPFRPVFAFFREAGTHGTFQADIVAIGRRNGQYRYGQDGSERVPGGVAVDVISVVPGTNNCQPAQSKLVRFDN